MKSARPNFLIFRVSYPMGKIIWKTELNFNTDPECQMPFHFLYFYGCWQELIHFQHAKFIVTTENSWILIFGIPTNAWSTLLIYKREKSGLKFGHPNTTDQWWDLLNESSKGILQYLHTSLWYSKSTIKYCLKIELCKFRRVCIMKTQPLILEERKWRYEKIKKYWKLSTFYWFEEQIWELCSILLSPHRKNQILMNF